MTVCRTVINAFFFLINLFHYYCYAKHSVFLIFNKFNHRRSLSKNQRKSSSLLIPCLHIAAECLECILEDYKNQPERCPEMESIFSFMCLPYMQKHCRRHCPLKCQSLGKALQETLPRSGIRKCHTRRPAFTASVRNPNRSRILVEKARALERIFFSRFIESCGRMADCFFSTRTGRRAMRLARRARNRSVLPSFSRQTPETRAETRAESRSASAETPVTARSCEIGACEEFEQVRLPSKNGPRIIRIGAAEHAAGDSVVPAARGPRKGGVDPVEAVSRVCSGGVSWLERARQRAQTCRDFFISDIEDARQPAETSSAAVTLRCAQQQQFPSWGLEMFCSVPELVNKLYSSTGRALRQNRLLMWREVFGVLVNNMVRISGRRIAQPMPPGDFERRVATSASDLRQRLHKELQLQRQSQFDFELFRPSLTAERNEGYIDAPAQRDGEYFWGKISLKGRRKAMEDELTVCSHFDQLLTGEHKNFGTFFGLYDGHHGRGATNFCKRFLHINTALYTHKGMSMEESLERGFQRTERQFTRAAKRSGDTSGSTALSVLLNAEDGKVLLANLGDSRAIVCRKGRFFELTKDHSADDEAEKRRVESEGGSVSYGRLGGVLAVSRAFGDLDQTGSKIPGLSATPDVVSLDLDDDFEFLLVACDGCWEIGPSEKVGREARRLLRLRGCPQQAAEELARGLLADPAMTDNLTLLLLAQRKRDELTGETFFSQRPRSRKISGRPRLGKTNPLQRAMSDIRLEQKRVPLKQLLL